VFCLGSLCGYEGGIIVAVAKNPTKVKSDGAKSKKANKSGPPEKYYDGVDAFAACAVDQIEACLDSLGYSDLPPIKNLVTTLLKEEQERVQLNLETLAEFNYEKKHRKKCLSRSGVRFKEQQFDLSHFLESKMMHRYFREDDGDDFLSLCFKGLTQLEYLYIKLDGEVVEGDFVSRMLNRRVLMDGIKVSQSIEISIHRAYGALNSALYQYAHISLGYEDENYWWAYSESQYYLGMLSREAGLDLKSLQEQAQTYQKLSNSGKQGAKIRHAKTYDTQEFAITEYRKRKYKSMRNGATSIEKSVCDYANKNGNPLSINQAHDTIYGWIRIYEKSIASSP
jgi:hypothetical protein